MYAQSVLVSRGTVVLWRFWLGERCVRGGYFVYGIHSSCPCTSSTIFCNLVACRSARSRSFLVVNDDDDDDDDEDEDVDDDDDGSTEDSLTCLQQ